MTLLEKIIKSHPLLTDGGLETSLIYHKGIDLPHFAAFDLLTKPHLKPLLEEYYREYLDLAVRHKANFILEGPTWRANSDWGFKLGYSAEELTSVNYNAIEDMMQLKEEYQNKISLLLVSGCIGPRHDGYFVKERMTQAEAIKYHNIQVITFKEAGADLCTALTMNYIDEGLGIAKAAQLVNLPVVISFTLETNGLLPSGDSLKHAIGTIDSETNSYPLYYMINCAHPSHFMDVLKETGDWKNRIMGIRANASCKSHAELDASSELDRGNVHRLSDHYSEMLSYLPKLKVFGGCCGTDVEHIEEVYSKLAPQFEFTESFTKTEIY